MRRYGIASLVAGALVLAGCAREPQEVTFFADRTTVRLAPTTCHPELDVCDATGRLSVPSGKFVNISVPGKVASVPWVVVFKYKGQDGTEQQARTAVFTPNDKKYAYTLVAPTAGDQLTHVEVRQLGGGIALAPDKEPMFLANAIWALDVTP
ncbi:DUF2771 family protein [Actinocrispum wychmicini]|uniref:Uncharacterized protein DUF2771 n=1 Tax=Actinocrispum wychmicini TaxID=1213861 RepID=A0A4R2JEM8_9PSEU|nr:DUF2771 family protein [Actinocrispum wychmicini]TCO58141.1 uncharacterized protein DUF2771 [Actinocrispum wychmicini]